MEYFVFSFWSILIYMTFFNSPSTTIILDNNGNDNNSIIIESKGKKTHIDSAGEFIKLSDNKEPELGEMSQDEIYSKFKDIISNQPAKPKSFLLYFNSKGTKLSNDSYGVLDEILEEIRKRKVKDVTIIGHTDTVGSNEKNITLSLKRAKYIKNWILSNKIKFNTLEVESHGENDLLIQTADNVSEVKNRRVEVFIR